MNKRRSTRVDRDDAKLELFKPLQVTSSLFTWMDRDVRHVSIIPHRDCIGTARKRSVHIRIKQGWRNTQSFRLQADVNCTATVFTWVVVWHGWIDHSWILWEGAYDWKTHTWGIKIWITSKHNRLVTFSSTTDSSRVKVPTHVETIDTQTLFPSRKTFHCRCLTSCTVGNTALCCVSIAWWYTGGKPTAGNVQYLIKGGWAWMVTDLTVR